ncbi:helix-turn-helix domain-containing protein [Streptomyces fulvoviolaceus]|uniref:helix-turn-helix domain-containing protein n=1 Tax=Streptomyces fulvoviolaceus TaxID=285535 RepID=UPI0021C20951|nr:helix-turn-helix domain-containing protein [Streptomyces fulvoviolaceus]MCT9078788.1 helix-turn-helix domain-containing protein [Streptomyces fulvoviolaceus]
MPAREIPIKVGALTPVDGDVWHSTLVVTLEPPDYPDLAVTFEYLTKPLEVLHVYGFHVQPREERPAEEWGKVGAGLIRDMPVARWEKLARNAAVLEVEGATPWGWRHAEGDDEIAELAKAIVQALFPDLDPLVGKAAARRWNRMLRLVEVTLQTEAAEARGEKSPAAAVAEQRGVTPGTVRSWLHQARQEGVAPGEISLEELKEKHPEIAKYVEPRPGVAVD